MMGEGVFLIEAVLRCPASFELYFILLYFSLSCTSIFLYSFYLKREQDDLF